MGGSALRRVLGLEHKKKVRVQDFHGSIVRDPTDRFWSPTFHPSFLRGATNLIGTVLWDRSAPRRREIPAGRPATTRSSSTRRSTGSKVGDGGRRAAAGPAGTRSAATSTFPDKAGGKDEGEITADDVSYHLLRHNVSCHLTKA
jgi:hypothetical protein